MQAVPATASIGPAYATVPTVGYRILALDGSVSTAYTTANVVSLGAGFYRVTGGVSAPDAGGIIQWWSNNPNNGGVLLAVASVEPAPEAIAGESVATAVWSYTEGNRSLTGPQAVNSATTLGLIQAFVQGRFRISYSLGKAYQYGTDGTVLQEFNLRDADGNMAINAQTAVDRVPVGGTVAPIGLSLSLSDLEDMNVDNPVDGSIPIWNNGELDLSPAVVRDSIIGGGSF